MSQTPTLDLFQDAARCAQDDPARALDGLTQLLQQQPGHYMAAFNAAVLQTRLGFPERALHLLDTALQHAPNDALAREMQEVFWSGPPADALPNLGPSPLKATGFFSPDDLTAAAEPPEHHASAGGLFCPRCNANVPTRDANFCHDCGAPRPAPPFGWYHDPLLHQTLFHGQLLLTEKIDWSGLGAVYKALDLHQQPPALRAVKLVPLHALHDPAGLAQDLDALEAHPHPAHPRVFLRGVLPDPDRFATVTDLLPGRTLTDLIDRRQPLAIDLAIDLALQLAEALHAAHAVGVLHLSLRPASLLIARRPHDPEHLDLKLLNLGRTQQRDANADLGGPARPRLDPAWAPPEQLDPQAAPPGPRADLYRLGAALFYALTGHPPYPTPPGVPDPHAHILALQRDRDGLPGPSPTLHRIDLAQAPGLTALVADLLATHPDQRPPHAHAVAQRLRDLQLQRSQAPDPSSLEAHRPADAAEAIHTGPIQLAAVQRYNEAHTRLTQLRADLPAEPAARADALLHLARFIRAELPRPAEAANALNEALDLQPQRLDAFKELTLLHHEAQRWDGLRDDYLRMIDRLRRPGEATPDPRLLAVLHHKLADLLRLHLNDPEAALLHLQAAAHAAPSDLPLQRALAAARADAAQGNPALLADAADALALTALHHLTSPDLLADLGLLQLRARQFDPALLTFRVLQHQGHADPRAQSFVAAHASPLPTLPNDPLDLNTLLRHLASPNLDPHLTAVFTFAAEAFAETFASEPEAVGLRSRDRLDLHQPTLFNQLYARTLRLLAFPYTPDIYRREDAASLTNPSLEPPALLVGPDLLSGAPEKRLAATLAKQLFLFQSPAVLLHTRPTTDLEAIFYTLASTARPNLPLPPSGDVQRLQRDLQRYRTAQPQRWDALQHHLRAILERNTPLVLSRHQDHFEDAANLLAALFADDLHAVADMLRAEPRPTRPERPLPDRLHALYRGLLDPRFAALRQRLGFALVG